jgi:hypothetical protein
VPAELTVDLWLQVVVEQVVTTESLEQAQQLEQAEYQIRLLELLFYMVRAVAEAKVVVTAKLVQLQVEHLEVELALYVLQQPQRQLVKIGMAQAAAVVVPLVHVVEMA